jgi:hypothetical protein
MIPYSIPLTPKENRTPYNSKAYETLYNGGCSGASFGKIRFSIFVFKQKLDLPLGTLFWRLWICCVCAIPDEATKVMDLFSTYFIYVGTTCDKCWLALFRVQFLALCVCGSQDNTFLFSQPPFLTTLSETAKYGG